MRGVTAYLFHFLSHHGPASLLKLPDTIQTIAGLSFIPVESRASLISEELCLHVKPVFVLKALCTKSATSTDN